MMNEFTVIRNQIERFESLINYRLGKNNLEMIDQNHYVMHGKINL